MGQVKRATYSVHLTGERERVREWEREGERDYIMSANQLMVSISSLLDLGMAASLHTA